MRKFLILVLVLGLSSGFFGCRSRIIKDSKLEEEALSLLISEQLDLKVIASFVPLIDNRPKEDIAYMTSVREKVSSKIFESIRDTDLFDEINFPANNDDILMLSGEIRRFGWESFDTMISYIPGLNVLPFFGFPSTRVDSEVVIYLELKNANTNEVIFGFSESYSKSRKYNIYNFKLERAEIELASCFDIVLARIKKRAMSKRSKVLEVSKALLFEAAQKAKELEVGKKLEAEVEVAAEEEVSEVKEEAEEKVEGVPETTIEEKPIVKEEEIPEATIEEKPEEKVKEIKVPEKKIEEEPAVEVKEEPQVKIGGVSAAKIEEVPEVVAEEVPETEVKEAPEVKVEEKPEVKTEEAQEEKTDEAIVGEATGIQKEEVK
ncbi:hypothetical protein ACFL2J_03345 [Candidatus Omnitrophota bacterium]